MKSPTIARNNALSHLPISCIFLQVVRIHKGPDATPSPQEIRKRLVKVFAPNIIGQEGKKVGVLLAMIRAQEIKTSPSLEHPREYNILLDGLTDIGLNLHINLEQVNYQAGDIVKGILTIKSTHAAHFRKLLFFAEGIERVIAPLQALGSDQYRGPSQESYDKFFYIDLSRFLQSVNSLSHSPDGKVTMEGGKMEEIPFEFTLPKESNYSYNGVMGSVTYRVAISVDIPHRLDKEAEARFVVGPSNGVVDMLDGRNPTFADDIKNSFHTGRIVLDKELFSSEAENKYLSFTQDIPNAKVDLSGRSAANPGEIISGRAIFHKIQGKGVRGLDISLYSIERTFANYPLIGELAAYMIRTRYVHRIELDPERHYEEEEQLSIPFSFAIPHSISPTYSGELLKLAWGIEVCLDIIAGKDVKAAKLIEIK